MNHLVWFRRDLRVVDNNALFHASKAQGDGVVGLFFITPSQWKQHDDASCKVQFWLENLQKLSDSLATLNVPLLIKTCDNFNEIPKQLLAIAKKHKCTDLYFNREYEVNELRRDKAVTNVCEASGLAVHGFHDRIVVPPREIQTKQGNFYSVFTPYRKVWDSLAPERMEPLSKPRKQSEISIQPSRIPRTVEGYEFTTSSSDRWPAGEAEARKRLTKFCSEINKYDEARDVPSIKGTSQLSPYLAAGVISPRQCLIEAVKLNNGRIDGGNSGAKTWISELTWRDFYTHVMTGFPRVSKHQPFKKKTDSVPWRTDAKDFASWQSGQTGYPLVDAGMRQLKRTGWMHNRLRMVTAMFLTKNLLIDWQLGERYFMENLIDGDLAANNGGWQWSASTGTDAVPYFRIFNPFSQSKRFDPDGLFIKEMCPELESVPARMLHDQTKLATAIADRNVKYPGFIVNYIQGRERALKAFKSIS